MIYINTPNKIKFFLLGFFCLIITGCGGSYVTPGGSVELSSLSEVEINELLSRQPAARFPVNLAIARIQASGYQSYGQESYGAGKYSVITTREIERDEDFARIIQMPKVNGVAPLNRIILPSRLDSIKDLRSAAARLRADILMIYTLDTQFRIGHDSFGPLNIIALGLFPNKEVKVTTTASVAFYDVRTEYLYGLAETTVSESKTANLWGSSEAVDELRLDTETRSFQMLISEVEKTWNNILQQYSEKVQESSEKI